MFSSSGPRTRYIFDTVSQDYADHHPSEVPYLLVPVGSQRDPDQNKCLDHGAPYHASPQSLQCNPYQIIRISSVLTLADGLRTSTHNRCSVSPSRLQQLTRSQLNMGGVIFTISDGRKQI